MYKRIWIEEKVVEDNIRFLSELSSLLIDRLERTEGDEGDYEIRARDIQAVEKIARTSRDIERSLKTADESPSVDERIESITNKLKEIDDSIHISDITNIGDVIDMLMREANRKAEESSAAFAKLLDDIRVKIMSLQYFLDMVDNGGTHNEKSYRIKLMREAMNAISVELAGVDPNDPWDYQWEGFSIDTGDWSYIRAVRQLRYAKLDTEKLKEENKKLRDELKKHDIWRDDDCDQDVDSSVF